MTPWPAVGSVDFCRNVDGGNKIVAKDHREAVEQIRENIRRYRAERGARRSRRPPEPHAPALLGQLCPHRSRCQISLRDGSSTDDAEPAPHRHR